jgi:hypothetical protein
MRFARYLAILSIVSILLSTAPFSTAAEPPKIRVVLMLFASSPRTMQPFARSFEATSTELCATSPALR